MLVLAIDPAMLAIPKVIKSRDDAIEILERLKSIHRHLLRSRRAGAPFQIRVPEDAAGTLEDTGFYPHGDRVKRLFEEFDFGGIYSPRDIHSTVSTILDRGRSLEGCLPVRYAYCPDVTVAPKAHQECHEGFGSKLDEVFVLMAVCAANIESPEGLMAVATTCLDQCQTNVQVHADVHMTDPDDAFDGCLPRAVVRAVSVCDGVTGYFGALTPASVWKVAEGPPLLHMAIRLAVQRLLVSQGRRVNLDDVPRFSVGAGFWTSLNECQADHGQPYASNVLDDCARVVAGTVGGDLSKFRVSANSSKQRVRMADGATAWRMHITARHNALRLMVWKRSDGSFEFANVGNKMEEWIDEGDPKLAFEPDEGD
jgi:hypothetical protein